ncbi:unnamed protein product [Miscanthus lutarioriparius]|uniref:Uncharacterized protein n=1 Tax=Miscanthus lutarioriparius TaxID=422564 RepID=A0A811SAC4_9POAL|nr:unnamed protein product [Miscanthus lutarioriparius]
MARTRCGCSCELLQSGTSIITDLKIDGYSLTKGTPTGDYLESDTLTVGGHSWRIRFFPNGAKSEDEGFISVFLHLDGRVADMVKAQFQFDFVDNMEEEPVTAATFTDKVSWGYPQFIRREELEKSEHLKNDSFTLRCKIAVIHEFGAKLERPKAVSLPPSDLHRNLGDLLLSEKGADVVFDVGGQTFAAHRCVLAARSPVFSAEELLGTMKESSTTGIVRVDDMEAQVFKALLYFVYTDSLPKTEERGQGEEAEEEDDSIMSQHLLVAADRYNLGRPKLICEHKLFGYIEVGTAATILTLAEQHNCHGQPPY